MAKISASHMGKKISPEHAAKWSGAGRAANKGRKRSAETRSRISAALSGKKRKSAA